jgi:hypothetical protein
MEQPDNRDDTNSIALVMVGVVVLAIIIIATLTLTAILSGPPVV